MTSRARRISGLAFAVALLLLPAAARACLVGTGTAPSCTEAALDSCASRRRFDGSVTFSCGGSASITVTRHEGHQRPRPSTAAAWSRSAAATRAGVHGGLGHRLHAAEPEAIANGATPAQAAASRTTGRRPRRTARSAATAPRPAATGAPSTTPARSPSPTARLPATAPWPAATAERSTATAPSPSAAARSAATPPRAAATAAASTTWAPSPSQTAPSPATARRTATAAASTTTATTGPSSTARSAATAPASTAPTSS